MSVATAYLSLVPDAKEKFEEWAQPIRRALQAYDTMNENFRSATRSENPVSVAVALMLGPHRHAVCLSLRTALENSQEIFAVYFQGATNGFININNGSPMWAEVRFDAFLLMMRCFLLTHEIDRLLYDMSLRFENNQDEAMRNIELVPIWERLFWELGKDGFFHGQGVSRPRNVRYLPPSKDEPDSKRTIAK